MDKREICIKIMERIEAWTDENGFETSADMEYELALDIYNQVINHEE